MNSGILQRITPFLMKGIFYILLMVEYLSEPALKLAVVVLLIVLIVETLL